MGFRNTVISLKYHLLQPRIKVQHEQRSKLYVLIRHTYYSVNPAGSCMRLIFQSGATELIQIKHCKVCRVSFTKKHTQAMLVTKTTSPNIKLYITNSLQETAQNNLKTKCVSFPERRYTYPTDFRVKGRLEKAQLLEKKQEKKKTVDTHFKHLHR